MYSAILLNNKSREFKKWDDVEGQKGLSQVMAELREFYHLGGFIVGNPLHAKLNRSQSLGINFGFSIHSKGDKVPVL